MEGKKEEEQRGGEGGVRKILAFSLLFLIFSILVGCASGYPINITDSAGRNVTIKAPIKKIIVLNSDAAEAVKVLGRVESIVGVTDSVKKKSYYFPELQDKETVGTWKEFDYEKIAELAKNETTGRNDPTLVITYTFKLEPAEKLEGIENITVVAFDFCKEEKLSEEVEKLGEMLGAEERANDFINWWREKRAAVEDAVSESISAESISEDELANEILSYLRATYLGTTEGHLDLERLRRHAWFYAYGSKPWVFIEGTAKGLEDIATKGNGSADHATCTLAGGYNIAGELGSAFPHVSWEWVLERNPDVIIKGVYTSGWGWSGVEEPAELVEDIKSRPGADSIFAVKDGRVYAFCNELLYGMDSVVGLTYWAEIFHPSAKLNPKEVYTEYLKFMNLTYPEDRIFVYPEV